MMLHTRSSSRLFLTICATLAGSLIASAGHANESSYPCATEFNQALAATGKPEYDQASQALRDCEVRANEQKRKHFADTRDTWAAGLKLPGGGWQLLTVAPDGTYAVFGSREHEIRRGNVVAVWMRYEYREDQSANGLDYMSEVERDLYDCERIASKTVSVTYYRKNNLGEPGPSYVYDEAKSPWAPTIPGTLGDGLLSWACSTGVKATRPH